MTDAPQPPFPENMSTYLTTEHFTLQGARSIVNSEISSRASLYFTTLSAMTVAAAFIAQVPGMGEIFLIFGVLAGPLVILLGLFTVARISILSWMDVTLIRAINRLRHFYLQSAPETEAFMLFPPYDDMHSAGIYGGWSASSFGDAFLSAASTVMVANCLVTTAVITIFTMDVATISVARFLPVGIAMFLAIYVVHSAIVFLFLRPVQRIVEYTDSRFPAPTEGEPGDEA